MFVDLLVVLGRKLPAGRAEGFSKLQCLLQGVDGLCEQATVTGRVLTLDDQAKSVRQLQRDRTHLLLHKEKMRSFRKCYPGSMGK